MFSVDDLGWVFVFELIDDKYQKMAEVRVTHAALFSVDYLTETRLLVCVG